MEKKETDIVNIGGNKLKKEAFIIKENHPAIGEIMIVDGIKYKIMDADTIGPHRKGTFLRKMTNEDEERIQEYEDALDELSSKLVDKVDIKRMIKENLRTKPMNDLKTGLYILSDVNKADVEKNHSKGCYVLDMHLGNLTFTFQTGADICPVYDSNGNRME